MKTKSEYLSAVRDEYDRWDHLLTGIPSEKMYIPLAGTKWLLKDVLSHLMAWQQVSNARLSAAMLEEAPEYPSWLHGDDPDADSDEATDTYNARIFELYHKVPQEVVVECWRDGFLSLMKTIEDLSDEALFTMGAFDWLPGYALKDVVEGTLEHHREHYRVCANELLS